MRIDAIVDVRKGKTCALAKWCHIGAVMNITIKEVPEDLHERLREAAGRTGRSMNKLILHTLEKAVSPRKVDRVELLDRIRRRRAGMAIWIDDHSLHDAIHDGRA